MQSELRKSDIGGHPLTENCSEWNAPRFKFQFRDICLPALVDHSLLDQCRCWIVRYTWSAKTHQRSVRFAALIRMVGANRSPSSKLADYRDSTLRAGCQNSWQPFTAVGVFMMAHGIGNRLAGSFQGLLPSFGGFKLTFDPHHHANFPPDERHGILNLDNDIGLHDFHIEEYKLSFALKPCAT